MKKIQLIAAIVTIFSCIATTSFAQKWTPSWQYESRARNVKFLDANIGYMSHTPHGLIFQNPNASLEANLGLLLKTTDGGTNWSQQKFDGLPNLFTMDFVDPDNGFMGGQGLENGTSVILKTSNGGQNWTRKEVDNIRFTDMHLLSSQNIFFVGQKVNGTVASTDTSIFMSSSNFGNTWTSRKLNFRSTCVYFLDANTGFMFSEDRKIYKTTNRGANWSLKANSIHRVKKANFTNTQNGLIIGEDGLIGRTTDGGETWSIASMGNGDYNMNSISFASANLAYMSATDTAARPRKGYIFVSTNGGLNWSLKLQHSKALYGISAIGNGVGYSVGNHGYLLKTTDNGQLWQPLMGIERGSYFDIHFPSNNTGYCGGYIEEPEGYVISKTTNAGQTWRSFIPNLPLTTRANSIFFTDSLNGYICAEGGKIYKTGSGGQDWVEQNSGVIFNLKEIFFVSPTTGFIVGGLRDGANIGVVLKTTNAGSTWVLNNTTNFQLNSVSFATSQIGYVAGLGGLIMKTTNAGQSWITQYSSQFQEIGKISAGNTNYAMALVVDIRMPLLNLNGENNWVFMPGFSQFDNTVFSALACRNYVSVLAGISLTNFFDVVITSNPTNTYTFNLENTSVHMKTYYFLRVLITPNMTNFALDNRGVILKKFDQLTGNKSKFKPSAASLTFDVYPNPSQGNCTIFTADWQQTRLMVMDILGKSIYTTTLTNAKTTLNLAKGVYFVRLISPKGQGMQKLLVE